MVWERKGLQETGSTTHRDRSQGCLIHGPTLRNRATWISTCSSPRLKCACNHKQSPAQSWSGAEHMMGNSLFVVFLSVSLNTTSHKSMSLLACPPVPPARSHHSSLLMSQRPCLQGSFQVGGFCTSVVMPRAEHVRGLPRAAPDGASEVSGGDAMHSAGGQALSLKRPHGGRLL